MALKCDAKDGATCSESGLEKSKGGRVAEGKKGPLSLVLLQSLPGVKHESRINLA